MNRARPVHVINSRLPVYKLTYGDGLGDVVTGLFTRIAPKILPIGKELASKAIGVITDTAAKDTGTYLYNVAKGKLASLVKSKKFQPKKPTNSNKVVLPSTDEMPTDIANEINSLAKQKLKMVGSGLKLSI